MKSNIKVLGARLLIKIDDEAIRTNLTDSEKYVKIEEHYFVVKKDEEVTQDGSLFFITTSTGIIKGTIEPISLEREQKGSRSGTVVQVNPLAETEAKVGDRVYFIRYEGFPVDGVDLGAPDSKFLILNDIDIVAILT